LNTKENLICSASKPLRLLWWQGANTQHGTINTPYPLLSLPFFPPSQKGPSLGLQMKQSRHLIQLVLLLLENIHTGGTQPSVNAQVKEQQVRVDTRKLSRFLTMISQAPPFITRYLLKGTETQCQLFSLSSTIRKSTIFSVPQLKSNLWGAWVAQSVKHLPSAQVTISGSWDRVLRWALCSAGSLLLPLPPAHAHSLSNK